MKMNKLLVGFLIGTMMLSAPLSVMAAEEEYSDFVVEDCAVEEFIVSEPVEDIAYEDIFYVEEALPAIDEQIMQDQIAEEYRVRFVIDGQEGAIEDAVTLYGDLIAEPEVQPVDGYVFDGWYTDPACMQKWDFAQNVVCGDTTLYARWIAVETLAEGVVSESEMSNENANAEADSTEADGGSYVDVVPENGMTDAKAGADEDMADTEADEATDAESEEELLTASKTPSVRYRTHVQTYGWQNYVKDGEISGTTGQSKRLEGINISLTNTPYSGGITYRTHVQTYGWQGWKSNGEMAGTSGESKRLEAIQIQLTGETANHYDVYYQTHVQHFGWTGWAKNGEMCGSAGYSYRLEGIRIKLVEKGSQAPGSVGAIFYENKQPVTNGSGYYKGTMVRYNTHVQTYGWQNYVTDGGMSGTSGQSKRLEGIHIALTDVPYSGGITYRTHVQTYGWQSWRSNGEMSGTSGESKRLEAIQIKLTGDIANYYDVYYRVHAQTYGWLGWAKNGESAGTSGLSKRLEAINIKLVRKGGAAPGSTATPYVNGSGTNNSSASGGSSNTNTNAGTNSGSGTNTTHTHNWVYVKGAHHDAEYKTVHHDAEYVRRYICNHCGLVCPAPQDFGAGPEVPSWHDPSNEHMTEYWEAVDEFTQHCIDNRCGEHLGDVEISPAYDEKILVKAAYDDPSFYQCSICGEKKSA